VRIDSDRCQGHGRCYGVAPEVFGSDEEGFGKVLVDQVPAEWEERAVLAAGNCPEGAVSLES
jgi:ferredoxin